MQEECQSKCWMVLDLCDFPAGIWEKLFPTHGNGLLGINCPRAEIHPQTTSSSQNLGMSIANQQRCSQDLRRHRSFIPGEGNMIRKLKSGKYRLYSKKTDPDTGKHKNLGTFSSLAKAKQHERAVQFFKRRH